MRELLNWLKSKLATMNHIEWLVTLVVFTFCISMLYGLEPDYRVLFVLTHLRK